MRPLPTQPLPLQEQSPYTVYPVRGGQVTPPAEAQQVLVRLQETALLSLPESGKPGRWMTVQVSSPSDNVFLSVPPRGAQQPFRIFSGQRAAFFYDGKMGWTVLHATPSVDGGSIRQPYRPFISEDEDPDPFGYEFVAYEYPDQTLAYATRSLYFVVQKTED